MNRLAQSSSPYLLLHKDNPVDWYPWGPEALAKAKDEDKPIFLSVGYSTCYWCHVMERESFTDAETAALMNRHFVNIKLDREERPDLDEIYMSATQILTQHGGWPNSVFLTTNLVPFFAGTYFPPTDRQGLPGFRTVLRSMAGAWTTRREDVERQADSVAKAIRHSLEDRPEAAAALPDAAVAERSLAALERSFDPEWGGFGSAPKFPTPANLFLLFEFAAESPRAVEMLSTTLDKMARGGIFDHLGGGFHRYATDREWKVPHFEKMLYDNGWLLEVYAREFGRSGDAQAARVVRRTAAFLARELTAPEGAFWSALDAETDGHEGAFYVWTREELLDVLDQEDFGFLAPIYGFDGVPFFEGTHYVLHQPDSLDRQAERRRLTLDELVEQLTPLEAKLFDARSSRKKLLIDDKVLTDWNGAAISGLATAARLLGDPRMLAQAETAAEFVLGVMRTSRGTLLHSWRAGQGEIPAFLADYAYLVRALLALARAQPGGGGGKWLESAARLTEEQIERLGDAAGGFFAAAKASDVLVRSKDFFDGAAPAANSVAILNLLGLEELTGDGRWRREAERALRGFAPLLERLAEPARMMTIAARRAAGSGRLGTGADRVAVSSTLEERARSVVTAAVELGEAGAEGVADFTLTLGIEPGWHVNAAAGDSEGPAWVQPMKIAGEGVEIVDIALPIATELPSTRDRERVPIYEGVIEISGRLRFQAGLGGGLRVTFQPCDETRCLPPVERLVEL